MRKKIDFDLLYEVEIISLSIKGEGVARLEGQTVLVRKTVVGDKVQIKIFKKIKRNFVAKVVAYISRSPAAISAHCVHYTECGGCSLQEISYQDQLIFKSDVVKNFVESIEASKQAKVLPCVGSPMQWEYRNKMELTFGQETDKVILGFHQLNSFKEVVNISDCKLQTQEMNHIINDICLFANLRHLKAYNPQTHQGFLRNVVIRKSQHSSELIVAISTTEKEFPEILELAQMFKFKYPNIRGLVWIKNQQLSDSVIYGEDENILGKNYLYEKLGDVKYKVSLPSFFQTNSLGAKTLYEIIKQQAHLNGDELVYDLFCGTGTIGLFLAKYVREVVGIEIVESAVKNAKENAVLNSIDNVVFHCGDVKNVLGELLEFEPKVDLVIIDPPRAGLPNKTLKHILCLNAPQIIYVSCNPKTMGENLKFLLENGYEIQAIVPVDMFPQTYHVECVVNVIKSKVN